MSFRVNHEIDTPLRHTKLSFLRELESRWDGLDEKQRSVFSKSFNDLLNSVEVNDRFVLFDKEKRCQINFPNVPVSKK